ncbi:MAG: hypothetical protein K2Y18_10065 [Alphaproteobacteria bacterium]|nr:hypothetical protein [Alphaproteobacteria bacterium]
MLKKISLVLSLLSLSFVGNAMDAFEPDWQPELPEERKFDSLAGLNLNSPYVRLSLRKYDASCGENPRKLALGAGHIKDVNALHPAYQSTGSNCLTGDYDGGYDFQRYEGWYTASAEIDNPFGSDIVLNLKMPHHQAVLFPENRPNFWDVVWDASYHPGVLSSSGLIANIGKALKPGGAFVFTLILTCTDGLWQPGHYPGNNTEGCFGYKLMYQGQLQFKTIPELEHYMCEQMGPLGFRDVRVHTAPMYETIIGFVGIDAAQKLTEDTIRILEAQSKEMTRQAKEKLKATEAVKIDPLFLHAGLGSYYVIAWK